MIVQFNPKINISMDKIFSVMKITKESKAYKQMVELYEKKYNILKDIINIQAIYCIVKNTNNIEIKEISNCDKIAYCFVSIGKDVVDKINSCFSQGMYMDGYMLNYISDELVMDITRQIRMDIKKRSNIEGYKLTKRYSPGECGIDISKQKIIYDELGKNIELNAYLTDCFMIIPEKATMFCYGLDKNIYESDVDHDCTDCTKFDCPYRKT